MDRSVQGPKDGLRPGHQADPNDVKAMTECIKRQIAVTLAKNEE